MILSTNVPGRWPRPFPDSTTGRVITSFSISSSKIYSEATPTAIAVLPEPAGPLQNVISEL